MTDQEIKIEIEKLQASIETNLQKIKELKNLCTVLNISHSIMTAFSSKTGTVRSSDESFQYI